jgi:hypothetical protein
MIRRPRFDQSAYAFSAAPPVSGAGSARSGQWPRVATDEPATARRLSDVFVNLTSPMLPSSSVHMPQGEHMGTPRAREQSRAKSGSGSD